MLKRVNTPAAKGIKVRFSKYYCTVLLVFAISLQTAAAAFAANEDSLAYKMAILHTRDMFPERQLRGQSLTPANATVTEFQWILDSVKYRSTNPEKAIADTIYEIWTSLKQNGKNMTLLETAQKLSSIAKNTKLFGNERVNFRMTSHFWLQSVLTNQDIETVIEETIRLNQ